MMTEKSTGEQTATRAELSYVSDAEPGWRRRRAGRGFVYLGADGGRLVRPGDIARIRALAIPPAWTDVWICPDPAGHIQATGRDARGRKQYRYHPAWTSCRDEAKFSSLVAFGRALPRLRARIDADLRRRGLSRERVVASVVRLLDNTLIRVGNDAYARDNSSFGLTTLRTRHLAIEGSSLRFSFVGKSGRTWRLKLTDRRVANVVRAIQELPGQRLIQYVGEDGERHVIRSQDVNSYLREAVGADFTSKHFRTWGATVAAALALAKEERPSSRREQTAVLNRIIDAVAARLRNTRAVCRRCYVHPAVIEAWRDGRLAAEIAATRKRAHRPLKGHDEDESAVLRWLSPRRRTKPEPGHGTNAAAAGSGPATTTPS
jgi:DNA topoisomerase-1